MLVLATLSLLAIVKAQQVGTLEEEVHPPITWSTCTGAGDCTPQDGEIVIDHNWRWIHDESGTNCYDGNEWTSACSTNEDCAAKCAVEGVNYEGTYGITTSGDALTLTFVTEHEYGTNVGSRTYLMNGPDTYQTFDLIGNEFAFDVDLSTVGCGLNSALYFVPMPEDGGLDQGNNAAGAKYGTGYCDSQCARDLKFIGGEGNIEGWEPSSSDDQAGVGSHGACCAEIDVWESNSHAYAFTPHACENNEYHVCTAPDCGGTYSDDRYAGDCDANGCDYNPYRMGNTDFYGEGKQVDTSQPFTVVSQFTAEGLTQFFVQGGARIDPPAPQISGLPESPEINEELCSALFTATDDYDRFAEIGGWPILQDALSKPQVLVMSIWADHYANMLWLDGVWPRDANASDPGKARGDCAADTGVPADVIANQGDSYVTWSNIRFGPIGSTTGL